MANKLQLWVSSDTGRLLSGPTSSVSATPKTFYAGDTIDLEVHLVEGTGVARIPYEVPFPAGADVKVSIGTVATAPTAGTWRLSVSSTETADLDFDATPAEVQTALNAIGAVSSAGGVTVAALGGGYSITWTTVGTKPAILSGTDTLVPSSYESIYILQAGSATDREIVFVELRQSPLALADSFSAIGTPIVSSTVVSAWNGTNKVVRVAIDPIPKGGTYVIDVDGDSAAIPAFSTESQVSALLLTAGATSVASVAQSGVLSFDIVLTEDLAVTVDGSGLIASPGMVGSISLATSEIIAYLGSAASATATLEISVTAAGDTRTYVQTGCTVANGVVSTGAVSPVPAGTILTESVANARFIRRDAAQSPSGADLDVIWPNLGVSADGSDVAAALSGANAPASGNVFATMADVGGDPFDQSLNTTDNVQFQNINCAVGDFSDIAIGGSITFGDSTTQSTAFIPADYLSKAGNLSGLADASTARTNLGLGTMAVETASDYLTTSSASSTYLSISTASSTYAPLADFDQGVKTTDSVTFAGVLVTDGLTAGIQVTEASITFPDATVQESAPVFSSGTGQSGGSGSTIHHGDYPDEITIVIGGVTYAMPARIV